MSVRIDIPKRMVAESCSRNRITRLSLFVSAITDDFGPDSDIDILVEFERDARVGFITLAGLEIELTAILGRNAELHTVKGLHPAFRDEVLRLAEVQYEQA